MHPLTSIDAFFFYFIIPSIIAIAVLGSRFYNSRKQHESKLFKLSQGIIIGNIISTFFGAIILLFLYMYILDMRPLRDLKWEFLTLSSIFILAIPLGIGIGTHIAGATLEMILREELIKPEYKKLSKTLHYFHGALGHRIPVVTSLLMFYSLTLLDLFKGQVYLMSLTQQLLSILGGFVIGSSISLFSIMGKCNVLTAKVSGVIVASLLLTIINESRNLNQHPVALLFTTTYITNIISHILLKQKFVNIRNKIKTITQYLLKWDGITIHKDAQTFRKMKVEQKENTNS